MEHVCGARYLKMSDNRVGGQTFTSEVRWDNKATKREGINGRKPEGRGEVEMEF